MARVSYIKGMIDHAACRRRARRDGRDWLHAGHVQIAGENTCLRIQDILNRAEKIAAASGIADTQQDVLSIAALTQQAIQGVDVNPDEQIGSIPAKVACSPRTNTPS
ncbi:MAG: hypothetical protein U0074_02710 [Kouleothrix sp.]